MTPDWDAIIVGAGAAGAIYADVLARAGKRVLVLERGPAWGMGDLQSSPIWSRRLKWGGPPVVFQGDRPAMSHNAQTGSGLGGAALHHYATWPRMPETVFRARERLGAGLDWPFGYDELRPWYDRIEAEAGIAGDAAREIWRPPAPAYALAPFPTLRQGAVIARGFAAKGWPISPLPVAVLTEARGSRAACLNDGWCDAGCPIGALWNPQVLHVPRAREAGARFVTGAAVTRVFPASRDRAGGVEYRRDGEGRRASARLVVVAASVIQTPRLLLASRCPEWPEGAGNDRDQIGRNLMMEGLAQVCGLFDAPTEPHLGLSAGQLLNRVRGPIDRPGAPPGGWQWQIAPAMKPSDLFGIAMTRADLFGPALTAFLERSRTGIASMAGMIEQAADPENRVTLSDRLGDDGVPLPLVLHRKGPALDRLFAYVEAEGLSVMRAAGAREAWASPFTTGHLAGGTPMGTDPARSAADPLGRVYGIPNLVLAGSGLFPANGGVSPTFTLSALALRSASHIRDNWTEYAG